MGTKKKKSEVRSDEGEAVAPVELPEASLDEFDSFMKEVVKKEPEVVEPVAVEPAAVEPAAVEPAAVEPAAVEPAAVEVRKVKVGDTVTIHIEGENERSVCVVKQLFSSGGESMAAFERVDGKGAEKGLHTSRLKDVRFI